MSIEVSARIGALIVDAASAAGVDPAALQAAAGWSRGPRDDPDARIPIEVEEALWDEAARRSGDDAFGLHTAERLHPGLFDVLDYAIRSSANAGDALNRLARYNRLVHDVAAFRLRDDGREVRIEHGFSGVTRQPARHAAEFTLASVIVVGRQITGAPLAAREVAFRHAPPQHSSEHERVFGVSPRFAAAHNELALDRAFLQQPLLAADPRLCAVLDRHADALLASLPAPSEATSLRLQRLLASSLSDGEPALAAMAHRLKISERSLQRRLAAEQTTFEAVLDALRRDLSLRYLGDPSLSIGEIAFLLGYSEPSAFHRAFKRWTGLTPSEQRRRLR